MKTKFTLLVSILFFLAITTVSAQGYNRHYENAYSWQKPGHHKHHFKPIRKKMVCMHPSHFGHHRPHHLKKQMAYSKHKAYNYYKPTHRHHRVSNEIVHNRH